MSARLDEIRRRTREAGAQAAFVSRLPDIRWATGFTGSNALLVVTPTAAHLVTDGRYTEQAQREVSDATVHIAPTALADAVGASDWLAGVDAAVVQSDDLTLAAMARYRDATPALEWVEAAAFLSSATAAKDARAIEMVHRAQTLTAAVFEEVLPLIRAGVTERELATELVRLHLDGGATRMSFDPIVAGGPNGALPHARPTDRALADGDLVVIDMGGVLDGYCSDMTRTVAVGEPDPDARDAYAAVLAAKTAALDAVRAGVAGASLDLAARDVLDATPWGDFFTHSLGHGVGTDVHEWPRLSRHADHVVPEGATITIEPGVYVLGRFGIRIEDLVAVTADGHDNLTPLTSEMLVL